MIKELFLSDSEILNKYRCIVFGNKIVAVGSNKKPVLSKCLQYARKGFHTELWYCHGNGNDILVDFWN